MSEPKIALSQWAAEAEKVKTLAVENAALRAKVVELEGVRDELQDKVYEWAGKCDSADYIIAARDTTIARLEGVVSAARVVVDTSEHVPGPRTGRYVGLPEINALRRALAAALPQDKEGEAEPTSRPFYMGPMLKDGVIASYFREADGKYRRHTASGQWQEWRKNHWATITAPAAPNGQGEGTA